jgi:murein endopeptidase
VPALAKMRPPGVAVPGAQHPVVRAVLIVLLADLLEDLGLKNVVVRPVVRHEIAVGQLVLTGHTSHQPGVDAVIALTQWSLETCPLVDSDVMVEKSIIMGLLDTEKSKIMGLSVSQQARTKMGRTEARLN